MMDLEICVDSVESALAAQRGGAQRIELCSALAEGGLTPSGGLIRAVRSKVSIGVYVMIRPRGGDFLYSEEELDVMRDDIARARDLGANGVVFGLLTADGVVDIEKTAELVELARPMEVTFHRAIDMTRDLGEALESVLLTGARRVLTSGGAQSALLGMTGVATLVHLAKDRIAVMVCGNVRPENVAQIAVATGATQFHAALRSAVPSPVTYRNPGLSMGDEGSDEYTRYAVRPEDVRRLRQTINAIGAVTVSK